MPHSILLYDALRSLDQGHLLRQVGPMSNGLMLENVPEIALVVDRLRRLDCLREVEHPDRGADSIHFFTLSDAGRRHLQELARWYQALPWYLKLWGRLGLPLPDGKHR